MMKASRLRNDSAPVITGTSGLSRSARAVPRKPCNPSPRKNRLGGAFLVVRPRSARKINQMFYCTRLDWDARQNLSCYAHRWAIEVTFENCKQLLGLEDPAHRLPLAVSRTAAMALVLYSLVVVWLHRVGHTWVAFPDRPWYRHKEEPSFADMLSTLRRRSWQELFAGVPWEGAPWDKELAQLLDFVSRSG